MDYPPGFNNTKTNLLKKLPIAAARIGTPGTPCARRY